MNPRRRRFGAWALACAGLLRPAFAAKAPPTDALEPMVRLDSLYIPALSLTSAAQSDAKAGPRATVALGRLRQAWPRLLADLTTRPPAPGAASAWKRALSRAERQIALAEAAAAKSDWAHAHEALEPVREALMQVRHAVGFEYYVDRLTAYHEPMEVLALAGTRLKPGAIDAAARSALEQAFAQARVRWLEAERHPADGRRYRLSPAREAQLSQGRAGVDAALSKLSDALRGADDAALLAALKTVKPPFARAFTAFGLAEGEPPF